MGVDGLHMNFHCSLSNVCQDSVRGFPMKQTKANHGPRRVSVNPTMIFHHKPRGLMRGDTDANTYGINSVVRKEGFTESMVWGTRLNIQNMLSGRSAVSQFSGRRSVSRPPNRAEDEGKDDDMSNI
jgi:hypothetical protein